MIDAQAVVAHLTKLGHLGPDGEGAKSLTELDWFQGELEQLTLEHHRDAEGNYRITLPGTSERSVVLGSYLGADGTRQLDKHLGVVCGLEIIKAVARRVNGQPPCTLQLVVWAEPSDVESGQSGTSSHSMLDGNVAAYLELHIESGAQLANAGTSLGMVTAHPGSDPVIPDERLLALGDEAIRELTGASASLLSETVQGTARIVSRGVPTAVMYAQAPEYPASDTVSAATRLHLLQAAEAYGRWTESTMHFVGGEGVDLWAREQRIPRT